MTGCNTLQKSSIKSNILIGRFLKSDFEHRQHGGFET